MSSTYQFEPQMFGSALTDVLTTEKSGTARNVALWFGAGLVFVRFSMLNEVIAHVTGLNLYLLYLFGVPAIVAVFAKGNFRDTLQKAPAIFWASFGLWLAMAIPSSIWTGGSASAVWHYVRSELVMVFVIGALTRTWRDCRVLMLVIAAAATMNLVSSKIFAQDGTGRLDLEFGTVANANDFAAHLLFVMAFLLWVVLSSKSRLWRLAALLGVCYGVYVVLASGSRGALIALGADLLFFTFKAGLRLRLALWVLGPLVLFAAFSAVPGVVARRLVSFSASNAEASQEALASSQAREYLLRDSIACALHNPIFGIGPGQFTTYEGTSSRRGTGTYWHGAHNSYTAAASEAGIPALFFYVAAIWSSWRVLKRVSRRTRSDAEMREIRNAVLCVMTAVLGFCTAIFFLNFTYTFYLPAMSGLAIGFARATDPDPNGARKV